MTQKCSETNCRDGQPETWIILAGSEQRESPRSAFGVFVLKCCISFCFILEVVFFFGIDDCIFLPLGSRQALQGGATGVIGQDVPYLAVWNFEADCGEISGTCCNFMGTL